MTLTREEIQGMKPGKELNELVMQHIFVMKKKPEGASFTWVHEVDGDIVDWQPAYFSPSTNISAAWEVESTFDQDTSLREDYAIELHNVMGLMLHEPTTLNNIYQFAHATPEQRCKAALLAVLNL